MASCLDTLRGPLEPSGLLFTSPQELAPLGKTHGSGIGAVVLVSLAITVWCLPPVEGGGVVQPPVHTNHTLVDQYSLGQDVGLGIIAIGDVDQRTEIIAWAVLHNLANASRRIEPKLLKIHVDGGEGRSVHRTCWSVAGQAGACDNQTYTEWENPPDAVPLIDPYSKKECWVTFRLTKYEFEEMDSLLITYPYPNPKFTVKVKVSPTRRSNMTYLQILRPQEGREIAALRTIKFRMIEQYLPVNWSINIDDEPLFTGSAEPERHWMGRFQFACPLVVLQNSESLHLANGIHDLVVNVFDGVVMETASSNFSLKHQSVQQLSVRWVINRSDYFQGVVFGAGHLGCQTIYDIDGDGVKEMVFGTRRGDSRRLWCFDAGLRLEWIYPEITREGLPGDPTSKVSLVDVDSDGVYELCLGGRGGRLHVLDGYGRLIWAWDNPGGRAMHGPPQAYDVDGDGYVEFFLQDDLGYLYCVDHEGSLVTTSPELGHAIVQPTVADIDQDGEYEVLYAGGHNLHCFTARNFYEEWRFETDAYMDASQAIVADVDKDGDYEALVWTIGLGEVICVTHQGEESWGWSLPRRGTIRFSQVMCDLDEDGGMDMVIMSDVGIFSIDIGGESPVTRWEINLSAWIEDGLIPDGARADFSSSYQLVADLDGDGLLEVLLLAPFPIVADAATGSLEAYYINEHLRVGFRQDNGGWWGDLDGDGVSEWICELAGWTSAQTQVYGLTLNGVFPAASPWPEYCHSALPGPDQAAASWLTLKAAHSNSMWFPISQRSWVVTISAALAVFLLATPPRTVTRTVART